MNSVTTRRMYRRVSAHSTALYLTSSEFHQGVVRDVSLNGFRIEAKSGPPLNTIIMLRLWLPGQEESIDVDQAVVRWAGEREFGLEIVALSNQADYRIASHVEQMLRQLKMNAVA